MRTRILAAAAAASLLLTGCAAELEALSYDMFTKGYIQDY